MLWWFTVGKEIERSGDESVKPVKRAHDMVISLLVVS